MHAWDSMKSKKATSCHIMIKHLQNAKIISLRWKWKSLKRRDVIQNPKRIKPKSCLLTCHSHDKMVIFIPGSGVQIYFGNVFPVLEQAWHPIILLGKAEKLILKVWQEFLLILRKSEQVWIKIVSFYSVKFTPLNLYLARRQLLIQIWSQDNC